MKYKSIKRYIRLQREDNVIYLNCMRSDPSCGARNRCSGLLVAACGARNQCSGLLGVARGARNLCSGLLGVACGAQNRIIKYKPFIRLSDSIIYIDLFWDYQIIRYHKVDHVLVYDFRDSNFIKGESNAIFIVMVDTGFEMI